MPPLDSSRRRALRAQAHHLHPAVIVGVHGLTPAVLHEIDLNLLAHELVKVRLTNDLRAEREAMLAQICAALDASPVQHLGKIVVVYRPQPEAEPAEAPRAQARQRRAPATQAPAQAPSRRRTARPASKSPAGSAKARVPAAGPTGQKARTARSPVGARTGIGSTPGGIPKGKSGRRSSPAPAGVPRPPRARRRRG